MGRADEEAVLDTLGGEPACPWRHEGEVRAGAKEVLDEVLVLGAVDGAGGVDDAPAGADEGCGALEQLALKRHEALEDVRLQEEATVGPAAQGAEFRARGIDEDAVHEEALGGSAEHVDEGEPGAGGAQGEAVEALGVGVIGEEAALVPHGGAEQERLPAGAGTEVEHGFTGAGLDEEAEELTALVLDFEQALLEGGQAVEVGARPVDVEGEGAPSAGAGINALSGQAQGELLAGGAQGVGAQADGARDIEVGAEVLGLGAPLAGEVVGEPIWEGGAEGERGRLLWGEGGRVRHVGEPGGLFGGEAGEPVKEGVDEQGWGRVREVQEEGEASAPEGGVEEDLLEGEAPRGGEVGVGTQGAIEDALDGGAGEDAGECLGGERGKSGEGAPGEGA